MPVRSWRGECAKTCLEKRAPPLTRRVRKEESAEPLDEIGIVEQRWDLRSDVAAHVGAGGRDVFRNLRAPTDDRDDVFDVVALKNVTATACVERCENWCR